MPHRFGNLVLLSVTGRDRPGITSRLTAILAEHQVGLRDVEQVTNGGNLTLSFLMKLDGPPERTHPVFKDLIFAAWELGVHADFAPIDVDEAALEIPRRAYVLTMFGEEICAAAIAAVAEELANRQVNIDKIHRLSGSTFSCLELILSPPPHVDLNQVKQALLPRAEQYGVDLALQRESVYRRAKRLVVLDMDSTLIQGEIIDALAERHGVAEQVHEITARAMNGELDFEQSLRERVGLLSGLPVTALEEVRDLMELVPGGQELIYVLKRLGYRLAVISGGFNFFTDHLKKRLTLDYAYANELELRDGRVTGRVLGPIVDAQRKADLLEAIARREGIVLDQVIAVGDGANDLQMLKRAGLGIAFNAKRVLREAADHAIDSPKLDAILHLLGIRRHELAELLKERTGAFP